MYTTRCLKRQSRKNFFNLIKGIALLILGTWIGTMLVIDGPGKRTQHGSKYSLSNMSNEIFYYFMDNNDSFEQIAPKLMAGLMFITAFIGLFLVLRGLWRIPKSHSILGKSVLKQAKTYETLNDLLETINADMERGHEQYEKVFIGREWVLAEEAMRISNIRGIFTITLRKSDNALCLVDEKNELLTESFIGFDDMSKAVDLLKEQCPDAESGTYEAYKAFLAKAYEDDDDKENTTVLGEGEDETFIQLSSDIVSSLHVSKKVPTSNFTWEDISSSLDNIAENESVNITFPGDGVTISYMDVIRLGCLRTEDGLFQMFVDYIGVSKNLHAIKQFEKEDCRRILACLYNEKKIIDYSDWKVKKGFLAEA